MNRLGTLFLLLSFTFTCLYAQNDNWKKHMGSLTAEQMKEFETKFIYALPYNLSKKSMSEKDCINNFMLFRKFTKGAPFGFYSLYSTDFTESQKWLKGKSVYETMLDSISDPAMRAVFINTILSLGHNFIDNLDSINVIRDEVAKKQDENDTISVPVGMIKYAHLYYKYAGNPDYYPANLYDKVKARENYAAAFKLMREKNIDPGYELEAFYVSEYYDVCEDLYQSDKEKYFEQFLDDYLQITQTCDKLLIPFYEVPDSIKFYSSELKYEKFRDYNNIANNRHVPAPGDTIEPIKIRFKLSGAANLENLDRYYAPRLDEHKNDAPFLERAVHLMTESGAMGSPIHIDYCTASYEIKHNFENSLGMGMNADDIQKKREYYLEALKYADTPEKKLLVFYLIAESTFSNPQSLLSGKTRDSKTLRLNCDSVYDKWEAEMEICNGTLSNIIALSAEAYNSSSLAIRDYPARACYMLGYNLRWKGYVDNNVALLKDAKAYIEKSQELDIVATNIGGIGVNAPGVISFIDKQITAAEARAKKYKADKAAQAAYEAYLKKKKAEEDFWNQH